MRDNTMGRRALRRTLWSIGIAIAAGIAGGCGGFPDGMEDAEHLDEATFGVEGTTSTAKDAPVNEGDGAEAPKWTEHDGYCFFQAKLAALKSLFPTLGFDPGSVDQINAMIRLYNKNKGGAGPGGTGVPSSPAAYAAAEIAMNTMLANPPSPPPPPASGETASPPPTVKLTGYKGNGLPGGTFGWSDFLQACGGNPATWLDAHKSSRITIDYDYTTAAGKHINHDEYVSAAHINDQGEWILVLGNLDMTVTLGAGGVVLHYGDPDGDGKGTKDVPANADVDVIEALPGVPAK